MTKEIEIKPVLELSPSEYSTKEYDYPNGSSKEFPKGWNEYWLKSLSDSGITDIRPTIVGRFFADIPKISEDTLKVILKIHLEDEENNIENLNEICNLDGGLVILFQGKEILIPQCCSSISDYKNWIEILEKSPNQWKQVWIGHPMVYVRVLNQKIQFSKLTEANTPEDIVVSEIEFSAFKKELNLALNQITEFKERVKKNLEELHYEQAEDIARILVYNEAV